MIGPTEEPLDASHDINGEAKGGWPRMEPGRDSANGVRCVSYGAETRMECTIIMRPHSWLDRLGRLLSILSVKVKHGRQNGRRHRSIDQSDATRTSMVE